MSRARRYLKCPLCLARFITRKHIPHDGDVKDAVEYETDYQALHRHQSSPKCRGRLVHKFAEANGWRRLGAGSHVGPIERAGYTVWRLPTSVQAAAAGGFETFPVAYAEEVVVQAAKALTCVRLSGAERAELISVLVITPTAMRAVEAARRLVGAEDVRALVRELKK